MAAVLPYLAGTIGTSVHFKLVVVLSCENNPTLRYANNSLMILALSGETRPL